MQGLHLTADLFDCADPQLLLGDGAALCARCEHLARQAGLSVVGRHFHAFGPGSGVTGVVLLAESHLAVHTWPEHSAVTLDVYVCNFRHDNSAKAQALVSDLAALFGAARVQRQQLRRGVPSTDPDPKLPPR